MPTITEILREYETAFRDLVTQKNWSSNQRVKETLRLNKDQDWSFICTALDVIGDTTLAIKNFLEYGLEGLTNGNDYGEKYLRLYGVLNSTYLQQEAIYNLCKFVNLSNLRKILDEIKKLKIFEIRNKIGADSSLYIANKSESSSQKIYESYVPIRLTLSRFSLEYMNNESLDMETVKLDKCLEKHLTLIIDLLDKTYEKSIKTLYKGNQKKKEELLDRLSALRKLKPRSI